MSRVTQLECPFKDEAFTSEARAGNPSRSGCWYPARSSQLSLRLCSQPPFPPRCGGVSRESTSVDFGEQKPPEGLSLVPASPLNLHCHLQEGSPQGRPGSAKLPRHWQGSKHPRKGQSPAAHCRAASNTEPVGPEGKREILKPGPLPPQKKGECELRTVFSSHSILWVLEEGRCRDESGRSQEQPPLPESADERWESCSKPSSFQLPQQVSFGLEAIL